MQKRASTLSNMLWKFAERISAQLVTLLVSIILARLLDPSDYGIVSIVTVFITIANVFVSGGFGSALIQKKDADILDFSSVLYFSIGFSIVLYLVLFFTAPLITAFYGEGYELITPVLRVLGLRLILSAINSVQQAYVSRHMIFKKFFWATLFGTVLSAVVGIYMAYAGFGVWALVAQYLTNTTVDTIVLNRTLKFKPVRQFSAERLKGMLKFSMPVLGSNLLVNGFQELRALIIGKVYTSADLAYYDKGRQFPKTIVVNINTSISSVLFPRLSLEQSDRSKFKELTRQSIRFSSYMMCPMMFGLAAVADTFVRVVLTEKWLPCVSLMQIFCVVYLFQPIHSANMQAINAAGRSDITLKLEIFKKAIELATLLIVMNISIEAIAVSMAVLTTAYTFVNSIPNKKLINYSFVEQMKDISPALLMSIIMFVVVQAVAKLPITGVVLLTVQILVGGVVYIIESVITKNKEYAYILNIVISYMKKGKAKKA